MPRKSGLRLLALLAVVFSAVLLFAADGSVPPPRTEDPARPRPVPERLFPGSYSMDRVEAELAEERARPYWAATELESFAAGRRIADNRSPLLNNDVLAFYGSPLSKRMGILGVHPIPELDTILSEWAAYYDRVNGVRGVIKAFYVIYGMAWPEGEIGHLRESRLIEYIEYALARGMLVYVDHQIGKYGPVEAMKRLLPYLRYPNVHLALDPEWRTLKPMEEIGTVTAAELN